MQCLVVAAFRCGNFCPRQVACTLGDRLYNWFYNTVLQRAVNTDQPVYTQLQSRKCDIPDGQPYGATIIPRFALSAVASCVIRSV